MINRVTDVAVRLGLAAVAAGLLYAAWQAIPPAPPAPLQPSTEAPASRSPATKSTPAEQPLPEGAVRANGSYPGFRNRDDFYKFARLRGQDFEAAFAFAKSLNPRDWTMIHERDPVFVFETSLLTKCVRRPGEADCYWTSIDIMP